MKVAITRIVVSVMLFCSAASFGQEPILLFTVLDEKDQVYRELKASDIQIRLGKNVVPLGTLTPKDEMPLELLIMIDVSVSQERSIDDSKKAAHYLIQNILKKEADKVAIAAFTDKVSLAQDLTNDFPKAQKEISLLKFQPPAGYIGGGTVIIPPPSGKTLALDPSGATSLWDSVLLGVEAMAAIKSTGTRKVVLLFSDGVSTYGEKKMKEAVDAAVRQRIAVFAVGIGDDFYGGIDRKNLRKLTEQTNGITIVPDKKLTDLTALMRTLEQNLRFTYELTFDHKPSANPKILYETRIEIVNPELKKRKLRVAQPKGYVVSN